MKQAAAFRRMIATAMEPDSSNAVIIVDFAENFKCLQQNAPQSAHYGQTPVSIFSVAVYCRELLPIIVSSDCEKHTKDAVLAYVDRILQEIPPDVSIVDIWSDNATSQFKNQFIMEGMKSIGEQRKVKINWNFFAPMHGKSVVDGIGGAVKRFVRRQILAQDILVKSAQEFTDIASKMNVKALCMNNSEIDERNAQINLPAIIKNSKKIDNIKKFHYFSANDVKIGRKIVKKIVGVKTTPTLSPLSE